VTARRLYQVRYWADGWQSHWCTAKAEAVKLSADAIKEYGSTKGFIAPTIRQRGVPVHPEDLAIWLTAENCGGSG
jgi:hypothetical protein